MGALTEVGAGNTDTAEERAVSAHTFRNATVSRRGKQKLRVSAAVAKGRANGLQATLIDWREIYRACSTLLG